MCPSDDKLREFRKNVFLHLMEPVNLKKYGYNYQQLFSGIEFVRGKDEDYLMVDKYCNTKFSHSFIKLWRFYFKSFGLKLIYKKINRQYRVGFEMDTFCKKALKVNKSCIALEYPKLEETSDIKKEAELWVASQKDPWRYITIRQGIPHLVRSFIRDVNLEISEMARTNH